MRPARPLDLTEREHHRLGEHVAVPARRRSHACARAFTLQPVEQLGAQPAATPPPPRTRVGAAPTRSSMPRRRARARRPALRARGRPRSARRARAWTRCSERSGLCFCGIVMLPTTPACLLPRRPRRLRLAGGCRSRCPSSRASPVISASSATSSATRSRAAVQRDPASPSPSRSRRCCCSSSPLRLPTPTKCRPRPRAGPRRVVAVTAPTRSRCRRTSASPYRGLEAERDREPGLPVRAPQHHGVAVLALPPRASVAVDRSPRSRRRSRASVARRGRSRCRRRPGPSRRNTPTRRPGGEIALQHADQPERRVPGPRASRSPTAARSIGSRTRAGDLASGRPPGSARATPCAFGERPEDLDQYPRAALVLEQRARLVGPPRCP